MSSSFRPPSTRSVLWEILAPYVRWPLYSPLRLFVVALALLAVLGGVAQLRSSSTKAAPGTGSATPSGATTGSGPTGPVTDGGVVAGPAGPSDTPGASPSVVTPSSGVTSPSASVAPFTPGPVANTPIVVAETFVTAWARRDAPAADWRRGVTPYASPALRKELVVTDPRRIPATQRTGPGDLRSGNASRARVEVPTDGGIVSVKLLRVRGIWAADDIEPVSSAQEAPTPDLGPKPASSATNSGTE